MVKAIMSGRTDEVIDLAKKPIYVRDVHHHHHRNWLSDRNFAGRPPAHPLVERYIGA
jgi:hypothetical protein